MSGSRSPQPDVFVVTLEAVEATDSGSPLTILAFVRADDEDRAAQVATAALQQDGWNAVTALRTAAVIDRDAMPEDFRPALANAERFGCALIVYEEP